MTLDDLFARGVTSVSGGLLYEGEYVGRPTRDGGYELNARGTELFAAPAEPPEPVVEEPLPVVQPRGRRKVAPPKTDTMDALLADLDLD